jgi:lipoate-protein ligase A
MHHGTLLIDVETTDLWQILNFNHTDYTSKSVKSVKSPIVNLKALNDRISVDKVIKNIIHEFGQHDFLTSTDLFKSNQESISKLYNKYSNWEWIFGETPKFKYQYDHHSFTVDRGRIVEIDGCDYHHEMLNQIFSEEAIKEVKDVSRII